MNLADVILRHAAFTPEKAALRFAGGALTYAGLAQRIEAAARALAGVGVGRGDRVAVLASNHPDTLVLLYACARLGAMLVPLNWRLAAAEQLFILADCGASALVVENAFDAVVAPLRETSPGIRVIGLDHLPAGGTAFEALLASASGAAPREPAADVSAPLLIVYTSGTTGRPKGAVLTQQALFVNAVMSQHMHGLTSDDHVLAVLPFFHVGGLNIQTTPALQHGASVTIHPRFAPDATLAAIAREKPSLVVLVPATLQAVIEHPGFASTDLSSLRAVTTGSTLVPQHLVDAFEARGVPVLQVYGSTETCPIAVYTRLGGDRARPGSTGLPGLCCEAKIVDQHGVEVGPEQPGEILVRGANVFAGYWGDEAATAAVFRDGWYRSGDIATRDPDGYVTVRDRKKNLIISGGENIYPAEIERVLLGHPAVAEAAVVGRPDPKWGEAPVAYVVLAPGTEADPDTLARHLAAELARFKIPREFVFVDALPRNALGKVQHFRLRAAQS